MLAQKNDLVAETMLLRKYAGLKWHDPDSDQLFVALTDNLEWCGHTGCCIIGVGESGESEAWSINVLPKLIKKTKQDHDLNVHFVHLSSEEKARWKVAKAIALKALQDEEGARKPKARNTNNNKSAKRKRSDSSDSGSLSDD